MNHQNLKQRLKGISAINITPFVGPEKEIDTELLRQNIRFLLNNDIEVIVPCGNTGEFYSLTMEECKHVIKTTIEEVGEKASVVVGVGYDVKTAIELSQFAQAAGAEGIMIHQPVHPFTTEDGLVDYYQQIASAIDIGVILYAKSPVLTERGYNKLTGTKNIVGIKYALPDLLTFAQLTQQFKDWDVAWVCGLAEYWAPFFYSAGGQGFTSGMVNVAPEKSNSLLKALEDGHNQEALDLWLDVKPFEDLRAKYNSGNNVTVVKEAMNMAGLECGNVRPPISLLQDKDREELRSILQGWGKLNERRDLDVCK